MKAFIGNEDWADEGDIFFYSLSSEEKLETLKELIILCGEFNLFPKEGIDVYWGTNECFNFTQEDFLHFIDKAINISDEEIRVFRKFKVSGFDIYDRIGDCISDLIYNYDFNLNRQAINPKLTKQELDQIKEPYTKFFGLRGWEEILNVLSENN